ncbi:MAG: DNA cytosine methyltransferase [Bacteroidales bacterium]|nr:DNA cytosine methyltransferase [Bacteroidales bacterium]
MTYGLDRASFNQGKNALFDFTILEDEQPTLTSRGPGAVCSEIQKPEKRYVVRRLTPNECEALQGFKMGWTDIAPWTDSKGKVHKNADSPRYKAVGNSIATGPNSYWKFILKRISAQYDHDPTMASLFDGIGGFPLLWDQINGEGKTLWASEIEEFPIAVTKKHFPLMKHFGDITQINGAEVPVVDCIIGGSPCQDLSIAGNRAGISGERSGLFIEQIRIIKEMRERDKASGRTGDMVRPRYAVWENVPGAFSSHKGEDFRIVLEEFCKICQGDIVIPECKKWTKNGAIVGDGFSLAWTVHDAKDWCVPQRRKRISLVVDFGGESAPEILFLPSRLSGNTGQSEEKRQGSAGNTEGSAGAYNTISFQERAGKPGGGKGILIQVDHVGALGTSQNQKVVVPQTTSEGVFFDGYNGAVSNESATLGVNCGMSTGRNGVLILTDTDTVVLEGNGTRPSHKGDGYKESETMYTLNSTEVHGVCYDEKMVYSFEPGITVRDGSDSRLVLDCATTLRSQMGDNQTSVIIVENHPNDSRTRIAEDQNNFQSLTGRMGTGGGNVPLVLQEIKESEEN